MAENSAMSTTIIVSSHPIERLNLNHRKHWRATAQLVKGWRQAGQLASQYVGEHGPSTIQCCFPVKDRRRRDPHNLAPTVKALIDGLVDSGVFRDDDSTQVVVADPTLEIVGADWRRAPVTITITPLTARLTPTKCRCGDEAEFTVDGRSVCGDCLPEVVAIHGSATVTRLATTGATS